MAEVLHVLPWMKSVTEEVLSLWSRQQMPHALCIHGQAGLGQKHQLAFIAACLFCEDRQVARPCGKCRQCILFHNHEHPDVLVVTPLEKSAGSIGIGQIRQLSDFVTGTAYFAPMRIVIIDPIDLMTTAAANALLKLLEEPPPNVYFLVSCTQVNQLMPTIRSRLQFYPVVSPTLEEYKIWTGAILQLLSVASVEEVTLKNSFILGRKGPLNGLDYVLTHLQIQLEQVPGILFYKRDLKRPDLLSEFARFQETMHSPAQALATHLQILIKNIGVETGFLFFELWLEKRIEKLSHESLYLTENVMEETGINQLWNAYSQIQLMRQNIARSPQLNKNYLERQLVDVWLKVA